MKRNEEVAEGQERGDKAEVKEEQLGKSRNRG